ncbi:MAG: tetratricopeptide repeat protein [Candidatus Acidiferrales bacterium]
MRTGPQILLLGVLLASPALYAQEKQQPPPDPEKKAADTTQESSSKKVLPPEPEEKPETKPDQKPEQKLGQPLERYDPYPAQKDLEVGMFYLHKGDVDAAIDRFKDAIVQRPNFAKPRLLLGEAYQKKGDKSEALKYYKEYLQVFPNAPDAKNVRKKIEKLSGE